MEIMFTWHRGNEPVLRISKDSGKTFGPRLKLSTNGTIGSSTDNGNSWRSHKTLIRLKEINSSLAAPPIGISYCNSVDSSVHKNGKMLILEASKMRVMTTYIGSHRNNIYLPNVFRICMAFEEAPIICKVCDKLIEFNKPGEKYFVEVLQEGREEYKHHRCHLREITSHVMQTLFGPYLE